MSEEKSFIGKYAKFFVGLAVICGAMSGSLGALISAPAMAIGLGRLTVSLPFFILPVVFRKDYREDLLSIGGRNLFLCLLAGFALFGHFFTWFSAVKSTNVSGAAVLASLHPLVVLGITIFIYKKKVSYKSIVAIIVALIGGGIIMGGDIRALEGSHFLGNIFAFLSAMCMGVYFAIGGKVRKEVKGNIYVLLVFMSCWICFLVGVLLTETPMMIYPLKDYLLIVIMAFVCQIGSHAVWNLCLGNVSSLYISTWEAGDPVISTIVAFVLVRQIPNIYEVIGCVIVVMALLFYNKFERESDV